MKIINLMFITLVMLSCEKKYRINLNEGVGRFTLGETLTNNPCSDDEIEISINNKGEIDFFYIKSKLFETPEGVKIGDSLDKISKV